MKRVWQPSVAGLIAALAVALTASAQADTSTRSEQVTQRATESPVAKMAPAARQCYESYASVFELQRSYLISCRIARTALNRWLNKDNCSLGDRCLIRIGRNRVLWKCSSYRDYGKVYFVDCYSARKPTHDAFWRYRSR
jgi:hypothetical protein